MPTLSHRDARPKARRHAWPGAAARAMGHRQTNPIRPFLRQLSQSPDGGKPPGGHKWSHAQRIFLHGAQMAGRQRLCDGRRAGFLLRLLAGSLVDHHSGAGWLDRWRRGGIRIRQGPAAPAVRQCDGRTGGGCDKGIPPGRRSNSGDYQCRHAAHRRHFGVRRTRAGIGKDTGESLARANRAAPLVANAPSFIRFYPGAELPAAGLANGFDRHCRPAVLGNQSLFFAAGHHRRRGFRCFNCADHHAVRSNLPLYDYAAIALEAGRQRGSAYRDTVCPGKWGIGLYLAKSTVPTAFGAAASFAALLLWLYYTAQIFLLGAEFTACLGRTGKADRMG